ncbi:Anaerobic glycerol-3-phosphate dehydrogenase subunit C [Phycisphaerae bacterium RAS1]|nr:Anaerobic glycerol-3-phosphate dehydrogenase subunit C [Phycisphaerae bacterium RAS1]
MSLSAVAMSILLLVGLGLFARTMQRRLALMFVAAAPEHRTDELPRRIDYVLKYLFGQARMFRYRGAGVAHAMIFGGFVVLALRTLVMYARGFSADPHFGFWLFDDDAPLGMAYLLLKDLIGVAVISGVSYFLYTRLAIKPSRMTLSREGVFILCMILGIILSDLFYEAAGYNVHAVAGQSRFHAVTPIASTLGLVLRPLPHEVTAAVHSIGFWLHALIVITFLNFLPHGKHFHVLTILPQVFFSNPQPRGRLAPIHDIDEKLERSETLGIKTARDLSWKQVLDLYTCTECGRCSDNCPATRTGKLLSPKQLSIDLRDHMYRNEGALLAKWSRERGTGNREQQEGSEGSRDQGIEGAAPTFVGRDGAAIGEDGDALVPHWINPETIWACTTCGACEQECPVFISYIDKIVGIRRNLVMEKGEFPQQLQNAFRGLESVGNPYSFDNAQRAAWADGLDVPLKSEKPDAEVLYWVGCAPSFDDRSRKIARATAQLLKEAGVDFAILGPEECCTGDPARRAGNEYLAQVYAKQNVEVLNNYGVKKIVTTCPHCFNALKNEYPDFGGAYEVVHHTEFLAELIRIGKLKPTHRVEGRVAYHDACYLGRHNDIYDPPRDILKAIPGLEVVEAPESRDRGMCCGAGGAQMWKEEEHSTGPSAGKVNHARTRQLLNVLPSGDSPRKVASACPFCMTMLGDGLRDQGHHDVEQKDVAELLLAAVKGI